MKVHTYMESAGNSEIKSLGGSPDQGYLYLLRAKIDDIPLI